MAVKSFDANIDIFEKNCINCKKTQLDAFYTFRTPLFHTYTDLANRVGVQQNTDWLVSNLFPVHSDETLTYEEGTNLGCTGCRGFNLAG